MNVRKNETFQLLILFIFLLMGTNSQTQTINLNDLDDSTQCFNVEKMNFGESDEIIYEIINNRLEKTLFIQYKAVLSIFIYKSNIHESNIIFSRTKEENDFENFYFKIEKDVEKYIIKIEFLHSDINEFNFCLNLFDIKVNSFKIIPGKTQKVATYEIINSGKFPLFINDNLTPFTALRINKKYEKYFKIPILNVNAKIYNSEEKEINLEINEFFCGEEYQYIFWNLEINKGAKIKEILVELNIDIIKYEEGNNKLEIELIKNQEIHYEYKINTDKCEDCPKIFYINLKKYIFDNDLDILCFSNIYNDAIFISDSYNINKENSVNIDKLFFVINKNYFGTEIYKNMNMNPSLLFFIIDEKFIYSSLNLIYSFIFAGSSHYKYQYHDEITKQELFKNNKLIINSQKCYSYYLINYFSDLEEEYIMEMEPILGNIGIYYSNTLTLASEIPDYLDKIDLYPIQPMNNSIITGDYGIFKINCEQGNERVLSYLNIYKKNGINDVIYFRNQKALIYLKKDQTHSFTFDSDILNEKFSFRIRILKKDEGKFNIDINYNNFIYKTLNENNFLELKHEKGENPIIYISLKEESESGDKKNKNEKSIILELIKNLNIDNNLIEIKKNNEFNYFFQTNKFLFAEYDKKDSNKIKLTLNNIENEVSNICIHSGYGIFPYLIKPECTNDELIKLKKGESISLEYANPFNNKKITNINPDNHFYISLFSTKKLKYDYIYEKYSTFDSNGEYKDLSFSGKEIIQLDNIKEYPYIYYQINICQDFNNLFQQDSYKPTIFNYYFEDKRNEIILNEIKSDIYKSYKINNINKKLNIIFTKDEKTIKGKFKYLFSPISSFNFNENFSKEIKVEQKNSILEISFETPFKGNLIIYFLFVTKDLDKYSGLCPVIDLFEELKKNKENQSYYKDKLYKKELYANENAHILNIDIEAKDILGLNRKEVKLYVINTLKMINFDMFYNPYNLEINLNDQFTGIEAEQNTAKKIVISIICLVSFLVIFILYRNYQRKKRINNINFEHSKMKLAYDVNESNKLF